MTFSQPLAFIDVETTGTDPHNHEIVELGLVLAKFKDNELIVMDQLDLKIHPKHIETAEVAALRVNGYNEADWLFATSLEDAMKTLAQKADGAIFVAHNMMFDWGFIEAACKATDTPDPFYQYYHFDTLSMAAAVLHGVDEVTRLSLGALCDHFSIENKRAHSAFADAYATYEVFKKLLKL